MQPQIEVSSEAASALATAAQPQSEPGAPLLVKHVPDSTESKRKEERGEREGEGNRNENKESSGQGNAQKSTKRRSWTKQQKRIFHRTKSLLFYWEAARYDVLWVVLTTAVGGDPSALAYHHKKLRNRIERELGFTGLEFIHVQTAEGNGVLHVMWAWKLPPKKNRGAFYIQQEWLSQQWQEIHGAPYVFIKRYRAGGVSAQRISQYLVSQYVSNQSALVRVSWSKLRSLGFPLGPTWQQLKSHWKRYKSASVSFSKLIAAWESLLVTRSCTLGETQFAVWNGKLQEI